MKLEEYRKAETIPALVLFNRRLTPEDREEVRELTLQVNQANLNVAPGQSIGVVAPGSPEFGHKEHFRLYTVADLPNHSTEGITVITLCVKRCNYIDEYSGEEVQGIASNYLCDIPPAQHIQINGPFGVPFNLPEREDEHLIFIAAGTGIAPFRAFTKQIYRETPNRSGKIWLFHGAMTGLELLYMNEEDDDLTQYIDRETFEAFQALSPRPEFGDPIAIDFELDQRADQIWEALQSDSTRVYVAGQEKILAGLNVVFAKQAGSEEAWKTRKAELAAAGRWQEIVY